jgi:death on curing protein
MKSKSINLFEVEYIAFALARESTAWGERMPDFGTRFPNKLESCLAVPFSSFDGKDLYRGLIPKASILFYLMNKNHPFENGNKRIAVMTLFYFLHKNNYWLRMSKEGLYHFAKQIAESEAELKDSTILTIQGFLKAYIRKI